MKISRRYLLQRAAMAGFASRVGFAADTDPARMIVRSPKPADLEMPLPGFNEAITPIERFYVRCHTYTPKVDLAGWKLQIDGLVAHPVTLTMAELKKMPHVDLVSVVECAGNGRGFYQPHVSGTQWTFGSVGNGRWTGVRLKDVLAKAGVKDTAKHVLFDGADVPLGKMEDFRRTITIEKAMDPDTLLAFGMNGQDLPVQHGFPLRLIPPGWAGDSWVKWVTHIEVLDHEFEGFWMKSAYRHPLKPVAPGASVDASQMVPVTDINVKSAIASPLAGALPLAATKISGAAWSNGSPVTAVDVSVDGGKTWNHATLGKDLGRYSWRLFEFSWNPRAEGEYTIMSRARNAAGAVQPMEQQWNPSGYLWNVVQSVPVQVSKGASRREAVQPPAGAAVSGNEQPQGYRQACLACHDEHMMVQQHLTRAQWDREIDKMVRFGSEVKPDQRQAILDYLQRFK